MKKFLAALLIGLSLWYPSHWMPRLPDSEAVQVSVVL